MSRETIFAQDIDFLDVAIDKNSSENSEEMTDDSIINFDDVKDDVKDFDSKTDETTDFDFFACRVRICS